MDHHRPLSAWLASVIVLALAGCGSSGSPPANSGGTQAASTTGSTAGTRFTTTGALMLDLTADPSHSPAASCAPLSGDLYFTAFLTGGGTAYVLKGYVRGWHGDGTYTVVDNAVKLGSAAAGNAPVLATTQGGSTMTVSDQGTMIVATAPYTTPNASGTGTLSLALRCVRA